MVYTMVYGDFYLLSHYYILFWTNTLVNGMHPLILHAKGLNSTTTILLEG